MIASWLSMNSASQNTAEAMNPYECSPTPSMFVPNQDHAVTMFPHTASTATPRSFTIPPHRA